MKYPNKIKEIRYSLGIYKQKELAEKINVHKVMVSKWEAGNTFPSYPNLVKLATVLKTSIKNLYPESPSTQQ